MVRLLPKPDGCRRPILHYRSGFRLWPRCAQRRVRSWAKKALPDAELNNSQGRSPGDMVWRYATRADLAQANNQEVAEMLWDVSKAFERVNRSKLVALAQQLGYPMGVLRLSLLSYSWPRY